MLEFELKPLRKYTIECPKCSSYRDKKGTRSLTVYRDADKDDESKHTFIRWECNHSGQCAWNERQWAKDPNPTEELEDFDLGGIKLPITNLISLPSTLNGNPLWWYKDVDGNVQYAVMRIDPGKKFLPVVMKDATTAVQIPHWPAGKVLFGAENLKNFDNVLVVEGERTAVAAQKLTSTMAVVTWRGGSKNYQTGNWELLKGKKVWLWPDNDTPGHGVMSQIADLLKESEVYLCDVSWAPEKGDLADNLPIDKVKSTVRDAQLVHKMHIQESLVSTLEEIDAQAELLRHTFKLGWPELDDQLKLPASGVVVVEGRTGHAKTGTGLAIAVNHLIGGGNAHLFSYEIPAHRVCVRIDKYLDGYGGAVPNCRGWVKSGQLKIYDQSRQINLLKLGEILKETVQEGDLVVIDYAQIVPSKGGELRNRMIELMDMLRIQANTKGFLVLLLSQLTPDYTNPLHDAPRDAKDIHMSAETVVRVWNKDNSFGHILYDEVPGNLVLHIVKNRDGESGHMIGFSFSGGAYLEPNGHVVMCHTPKREENRSTKALETIAMILQQQFGGI